MSGYHPHGKKHPSKEPNTFHPPRPGPSPSPEYPPRAPVQDPNDPSLVWWATNSSGGGYYIKRADVPPGPGPAPAEHWTKEDGIMVALTWVGNRVPPDKQNAFANMLGKHFDPSWDASNNGMLPLRMRQAIGRTDGYDPFKQAAQAMGDAGQTPQQVYDNMTSLNVGTGFSSAFGTCTMDDILDIQARLKQWGIIK